MNFKIEKDKCIGCGACVSICESVYEFDNEGLVIIKSQPNEKNLKDAIEGLEACPTDAITKED